MTEQGYNDDLLMHYLLGLLPEGQTETCDELSIVDDHFAARLEDIENDLIDGYIRGELTGRELSAFETHYLRSPRRREKVKFARAFQSFAKQRRAAPAKLVVVAPQESRVDEPKQNPFQDSNLASSISSPKKLTAIPKRTLQWGLAAAATLLLIAGGWLVFEIFRLQGQLEHHQSERAVLQQRERELQVQLEQQRSVDEQTNAQLQDSLKRTKDRLAQLERQQELAVRQGGGTLRSVPNIVPLTLDPQRRSNGNSVTLSIPSGTDYIAMQVQTEADDYTAYRAEIRSETGDQKVWSSGKLKAQTRDDKKLINISIRADRLASRGYYLTLKGITDQGRLEDVRAYSFRIVRQ